MLKKTQNKLFVVKKYIWAKSASDALKRERAMKPDDVWIDEDWKRKAMDLKDAIGFEARGYEED